MSHYFNHGTRTPRGDHEHLHPPGGGDCTVKTVKCPNCDGDGTAYHGTSDLPYEHSDTKCSVCSGRGWIERKLR